MRTAALRLRGRDGPLRAELTWPPGPSRAVVVLIDDGTKESLAPEQDAVTLRVECATHHDARIAIEWTRAHAKELGVPPGRVIVR